MRSSLSASMLLPLLLLASTASAFWMDELERPAEELGGLVTDGAKQLESRLEEVRRTLEHQKEKLKKHMHEQHEHPHDQLQHQHHRYQHQQLQKLQHQHQQLQHQHQMLQHQKKNGHDSILVTRDRAGSHMFRMHNGRVVSAQPGASRSYRVHEGIFFSKLCVIREARPTNCIRRFKPAFYGLLAAGCLLAIALVASIAACVVKRRRAAAVAASSVLARRPLLGGRLSVQCDPITTCDGVYGHRFQKDSI